MYTIISGTNRPGSNTLKVAKEYQHFLSLRKIETTLLSLEHINVFTRDKAFHQLESDIIKPSSHLIFITPEYNGTFPGVLKMLFDNSSSHSIWWQKKALLAGVSTGRAGNLRGLDHLTAVLNYLKITVCPHQLPISVVNKLMDDEGKFTDLATIEAINKQLDEFVSWSNQAPIPLKHFVNVSIS